MRKLALLLPLMFGFGACSLSPNYQRPTPPVATDWPALPSSPSSETAVSSVSMPSMAAGHSTAGVPWQIFFQSPQLEQLITLALANNRDLRIAIATIERTRAQYQVQRADRLPNLNANSTSSRLRTPGDLNSTGAPVISSQYTVGLGVTAFELDLFGRVRNLSDAALAHFLASEDARNSVQISLIAEVANAYLTLIADEELLKLTRQTLQTREASYQLARLLFDNGASSELDLRQAQTLVESARATLAQQTRQQAQDINALTLLIGQTPPLTGLAEQTLSNQPIMAEIPAGLPSDLLQARPDIRQQEALLRAAYANIGAARAAFFPRISLTGNFGNASSELSGLFAAGSGAWSLAPQLVLPIFDTGRNLANLDIAQADREIALAQYEKTIQTAFREVADALAGRATLNAQLQAQRALAEAEHARFRLSRLRYQNGVSSYLDLLDAQRALFSAQQATIQTQLAELQNRVMLYKALGGGWQTTLAMATHSDS